MSGAPGISIKAVLAEAPETSLRDFIGEPTLAVLRAIDPSAITRPNLAQLAELMAEPADVLRTPRLRNVIISLLPWPKAKELASRLQIKATSGELFAKISASAADSANEAALFSFFGVMSDLRAPGSPIEGSERVEPAYALFDHQADVAVRTTRILAEYPHKALVHMPTGSGKTRTAMHIVSEFVNRQPDKLVVWLAQSSELLDQAADEFIKAWSCLGRRPATVYRYWADNDLELAPKPGGFLVAGLAKLHSLSKRDTQAIIKIADQAALTVIDEAHQAVAPTYQALLNLLHDKKPGNALLGLTATPGRTWADISADAQLSAFFANRKITLEVAGYSNPVHYLIEQGYLAKPLFRTLNSQAGFIPTKKDIALLANSLDVPESVIAALSVDDQRNITIISAVEDLATRHRRIIVFAASAAHAHLLSSILSLRKYLSFVVTAQTEKGTRERIINRFRSHDPRPVVVCNYGVLTTGFDAPQTSAALIARPTRSLVLYSQMVGRAIRGERAGGNKTAEIVTVVDPQLSGFGDLAEAFTNWEDVWGP